ncbi:MAG: DUF488 domain-containing protein [Anaeroplasma bactoclasticum]|nr:DUF488 domain-containing protein [Anaeroplasma bactoclasticum]MCM1557773.1 DUF488 domain-containing protein [Anaeroplasma bactoclasticum]
MNNIYTIGFTKKDAKTFFDLLKNNGVTLVVDVRLNNTSQLSGFSKYPDIKYFLLKCAKCQYKSDKNFSPEETTLNDYKKKKINWEEYVIQFDKTMNKRYIKEYIKDNYSNIVEKETICFLCSEETAQYCHRRLVAEFFAEIFKFNVIHLV